MISSMAEVDVEHLALAERDKETVIEAVKEPPEDELKLEPGDTKHIISPMKTLQHDLSLLNENDKPIDQVKSSDSTIVAKIETPISMSEEKDNENIVDKNNNADQKEAPNALLTDVTIKSHLDNETEQETSGSSQNEKEEQIKPDPQPERVPRYEELIVDGFAIRAFQTWEDLQDEVNEQIALKKSTETKNNVVPLAKCPRKNSKSKPSAASNNVLPDGKPARTKRKEKDKTPSKKAKKPPEQKSSVGSSSKKGDENPKRKKDKTGASTSKPNLSASATGSSNQEHLPKSPTKKIPNSDSKKPPQIYNQQKPNHGQPTAPYPIQPGLTELQTNRQRESKPVEGSSNQIRPNDNNQQRNEGVPQYPYPPPPPASQTYPHTAMAYNYPVNNQSSVPNHPNNGGKPSAFKQFTQGPSPTNSSAPNQQSPNHPPAPNQPNMSSYAHYPASSGYPYGQFPYSYNYHPYYTKQPAPASYGPQTSAYPYPQYQQFYPPAQHYSQYPQYSAPEQSSQMHTSLPLGQHHYPQSAAGPYLTPYGHSPYIMTNTTVSRQTSIIPTHGPLPMHPHPPPPSMMPPAPHQQTDRFSHHHHNSTTHPIFNQQAKSTSEQMPTPNQTYSPHQTTFSSDRSSVGSYQSGPNQASTNTLKPAQTPPVPVSGASVVPFPPLNGQLPAPLQNSSQVYPPSSGWSGPALGHQWAARYIPAHKDSPPVDSVRPQPPSAATHQRIPPPS